jgi:hypothetical protein
MAQFVVEALNYAAVILELAVVIPEYALVIEHFDRLIVVLAVDKHLLNFEEIVIDSLIELFDFLSR